MRNHSLNDVNFDPEGGCFCVSSPNLQLLTQIADIIKDLCSSPQLMEKAIKVAEEQGYFE